MNSANIVLVGLLCLFQVSWAQQGVCQPKDPGPFLATLPQLVFTVREGTTADIKNARGFQRDWYRSEIRLNGSAAVDYEIRTNNQFAFLNPMDYFEVVTEEGVAYLKLKAAGIDRDGPTPGLSDDVSIIKFTLTCVPNDNSAQVVYEAMIHIEDVNDNKPMFTNMPDGKMNIDVSESMPLDITLTTIMATDLDLNLGKNLTFSVVSHEDKFKINANTGELMLRSRLDFDGMGMMKYYDVVIKVEDGGPTPASGVTGVVRVNVHDEDDMGPMFKYPGCWLHRDQCALPGFRTGRKLVKGTPLVFQPVPNKGQGPVDIEALDLDVHKSGINFIIANTIPPGEEDMFTLVTSMTTVGSYKTKIIPKESKTVKEGYEILLKAEEDNDAKKFVVVMIYFTGGVDSGNDGGKSDNKAGASGQNSGDSPVVKEGGDDDDYSDREMGLVVATAVLASLLFCVVLILIYIIYRRRNSYKSNGLSTATNVNSPPKDVDHDKEEAGVTHINPTFNTSM